MPLSTPVIVLLCLAQTLSMLGAMTVPALLPVFQREWLLSNTEAGWLAGIQYGGYMLAVPLLSALTDRFDPRRIYLAGALMIVVTPALFAWLAEGFWSALLLRAVYGMGFAATYMPGLRALSDGVADPQRRSRIVTWYTVSFSAGNAGSILLAAELGAAYGWRAAFWATAFAGLLALIVNFVLLPRRAQVAQALPRWRETLDFRPVLRHRPALAYIAGYTGHTWELFGLGSWGVAFLTFCAASSGGAAFISPAAVVTIASIAGLGSALLGGELAARWGRRAVVLPVMAACALFTVAFAPIASLGYAAAVVAAIFSTILLTADSPALTAGLVNNAPPGRAGVALGLHSFLGFGAGFVAPLIFGVVLDLAGAGSYVGWTLAYGAIALGVAAGWILLARWSKGS